VSSVTFDTTRNINRHKRQSRVERMSVVPNGRNRVRRETGKEQMVRVHYDEGAAIHIGPASCAGGRDAVREALTAECAGQPLSHERPIFRVPTPSDTRKATRRGALSQAPPRPGASETLACAETLCSGTGRSRD
jgi:hypothetical protein